MELETVWQTTGFRLGELGPVAISVWDAEPKLEHATRSVTLLRKVARSHDGIVLLAVLASDCALPNEAVRSALARGLTEIGGNVAAVANVVEGGGFRAAALRGVVTSLALVMRPRYPQRVFESVPPACAFLGAHLPTPEVGRALVAAVSQLRAKDPR